MNPLDLVRPLVKQLKPYSSARDEFHGKGQVFLDANENPFDTCLNRYPDPYQRTLKEEMSNYLGVSPERLLLGNGSDECLDILFRTFCEPADEVIVLPPTYGMYKVLADLQQAKLVEVPLNDDFQPNLDLIREQVRENTKLLFVCSPNNPTGNQIGNDQLRELLKLPVMVVVDEAYIDFSDEPSALELIQEHTNLVVMRTFSKAWGLAAVRLGWLIAVPELIQMMNKVKPPYNVNELTQREGHKALANAQEKEDRVATIVRERKRLAEALSEMAITEHVFPSVTNFLLVRFTEDPKTVYNYLLNQGIVVRDRSGLPGCQGCLRITIGTSKENDFLLDALKNYTA